MLGKKWQIAIFLGLLVTLTGCSSQDKGVLPMIESINAAQRTIYAQVYEFNSQPIAAALAAAVVERGVEVQLIADKSALEPNSLVANLANQGILVFIDDKAPAPYENVFIIDEKTAVVILNNKVTVKNESTVVEEYLRVWQQKKAVSRNWGRVHVQP